MKKYESQVLEICENGDAIVELPDELCEEMGWKIGDVLDMKEKDGKIVIRKMVQLTVDTKGNIMNIEELARKIAIEHRLPRAERYTLSLRDFDDSVEVLGYVQDPNYNMEDFEGREMLFPKRWVTIGVLPAQTKVEL